MAVVSPSALLDTVTRVPWAAVATLLVSAGAGYRYLFTPRPVTGVAPTASWLRGAVSSAWLWVVCVPSRRPPPRVDDDQLAPDELAVPVHGDEDVRYRTNARPFRVDDGCVDVPVVVQNGESRTMSDYKFTITFADDGADDDHVRIRDVQTETTTVDGLFRDPECSTSDDDRIPDDRTIEPYDRLGMPGHFLSLDGSLGSGTTEIVVLELSCPASLDGFFLRIGVDSSAWFLGETTHCQYVSLERGRN